jgi:dephospho-CoA kinase
MMTKLKIAVTGGIGSGKTKAVEFFKGEGFPVIDADYIAKQFLKTEPIIRKKITKEFGEETYIGSEPNIEYLAEKIFCDAESLEKINAIVHPLTIKKIDQETRKLFKSYDIVFVESALIFEAKLRKRFNYIVLVTADEKTRIERIIKRDNTSPEKILNRMKFQMDDEKKIQLCDFVIENNGTVDELKNKCLFVLQMLKSFIK